MRSIRRVRVLTGIAALLVAALPGTAAASCVMPLPLGDAIPVADVVIVGTVTSTENLGRWAAIAVEDIWKGPDLPGSVVVRAGPAGNAATSGDRMFEAGVRYLFMLGLDEQGGLTDNACSSTTAWDDSMGMLRPAGARAPTRGEPEPPGFDLAGLLAPVGVAVIVGGTLFIAGLMARGRRAD
jgi:hypothetical protein